LILSDRDILNEIKNGTIIITPPIDEQDLSPCTLDVHLGTKIFKFKQYPAAARLHIILSHPDLATSLSDLCDTFDISHRRYTLEPNEFVLAYTKEKVKLPPRISARIEGRSTNARYGLAIHNTAPIIHPTFNAPIMLEMCNVGTCDLELSAGDSIGQLIFERVESDPLRSLVSAWQGQKANLRPGSKK